MLKRPVCAILSVVMVLGLTWIGCSGSRPIKVGFSGELTGRRTDLGIDGRDGVQLAVQQVNDAGGVNGQPIELLVRDDQGTPEGAQAANRSLIEAGVVAIIGHMTSSQSMAGREVTQAAGVILLSPTTSTPQLSGLDDYFFRVNPVSDLESRTLARHIYSGRGLSRTAIFYDTDNTAYTQNYVSGFVQRYSTLGGQVIAEIPFSSSARPDLAALVDAGRIDQAEAVLIVAAAGDAALLAQRVVLRHSAVKLFASGWASTESLIQNGGRAVEGLELVVSQVADSQSPVFVDFQARFEAQFDRSPTFAAAQAYEAVLVLVAALEKSQGRSDRLKSSLLQIQDFPGLNGTISFDPFGDVIRTQFLIVIEGGCFVTRTTLEPER